MAIAQFPPVDTADEHGLLALGGDLELESLLLAYSKGIFPWPISSEYPLAWFSPDPRGILAFEKLHMSKSLRKFLRKSPYEVKFNTNFEAVIMNCAQVPRSDNQGTWITQDIINAYINLFKNGFAYSVETYLDERLVGGIYGVCINKFYSGESMFHIEDNASKVALISLLYQLHQQGIGWIDTQMVTPVVESLGGVSIPRETYLKMLHKSLYS
ncbi:leucyl/phenylalanyl-tRNA--protein transferase [Bacteriovorax stolpii]|uniref:leucyl/phenylalanyl-tRNA--protein transferase n=1 Tax=Bacteriovorax stolpii TaxID=960 RepID=UPI00115C1E7E|nr:leucyl/phenylalanyl-tRNA--protein transferase [Bacteriovorax stolpii]QDK41255.1 leucyl/phenylalanyl-tRNA--protein transferase [Bacteriovorax stolpii]